MSFLIFDCLLWLKEKELSSTPAMVAVRPRAPRATPLLLKRKGRAFHAPFNGLAASLAFGKRASPSVYALGSTLFVPSPAQVSALPCSRLQGNDVPRVTRAAGRRARTDTAGLRPGAAVIGLAPSLAFRLVFGQRLFVR